MESPQEPPTAFMTALVTEHSVLQGARSTLTSESASRSALFLGSLTGSLIALGFVSGNPTVLGPFAAAIVPALVILGEFTFWRLVQGGVEDLHHSVEIQRIRAYYRQLVPSGLGFFADAATRGYRARQRQIMGIKPSDLNFFLTASSMVAAINSMLAGAGLALALHAGAELSPGGAIAVAVVVAVSLYLAHFRLAISRYNVGMADVAGSSPQS